MDTDVILYICPCINLLNIQFVNLPLFYFLRVHSPVWGTLGLTGNTMFSREVDL